MSEETDKTQSRPPVRPHRGQRATAGRTRPAATRPTTAQPTTSQGARRRDGSRPRTQGARPATRRPQGDVSRTRKARRNTPMMPLVPALVAMAACVVVSALVTHWAMAGKVERAQAEAAVAQTKVEELSRELDRQRSGTSDASQSAAGADGAADGKGASDAAGVDDPWLASGTYTTGDATLDGEVKSFCDEHANTSMGLDAAALEVYKAVAWSDYVERDDAQQPSGDNWRVEYAKKYFEHDCSGNCYEFAAFLSFCLQYLGFDDAHAEAVIVELQSGKWGDHGLVYVTNTDGSRCLCDTSLGTDGWMLPEDAYNVQIKDFSSAA